MAFSFFKSGIHSSQFRYMVHSNNWMTYNELTKLASIHAKTEHFNSKGEPSAPSRPSAPSDRPKEQAHHRFPSAPTNQPLPFRTAPPVSTPFTEGKRKDEFQNRQNGNKGGKDPEGRVNFRDPKDRQAEIIGRFVEPIGSIQLPLAIDIAPRRTLIYNHFLVVDCPTAYNAIIGRLALTGMKALLSPHMLLLKFPTLSGIGQV
ncbi:unnamed protein product [Prunus armeniaca]